MTIGNDKTAKHLRKVESDEKIKETSQLHQLEHEVFSMSKRFETPGKSVLILFGFPEKNRVFTVHKEVLQDRSQKNYHRSI